jgi:tRNA A37 threonylcarbamoyladenosine synthetase subunit TsaC/SUA5/YrdC
VSTSTTTRKGELLIDPHEIKSVFNFQVDLMLASGNLSGTPSSVIDLSGEEPVIVREGAGDITTSTLTISLFSLIVLMTLAPAVLRSPG